MKKIYYIVLICFMSILALSTNVYAKETTGSIEIIGAMDTFIEVYIAGNKTDNKAYFDQVKVVFEKYHALSDNFRPKAEDSPYLKNVYDLNNRLIEENNIDIEIDKELYDMLFLANEVHVMTDGYFNIAIGQIIDLWKNAIETFDRGEVPEENYADFEVFLDLVRAQEVLSDAYTLKVIENKYYINIKPEVKLDLGAVAKGYATKVAHEYLKSQSLEYFYIDAGTSSLAFGKNNKAETDYFNVGLKHPIQSGIYAEVKVLDKVVTSSGNSEQYFTYKKERYHHLISPKTKFPEHYYHVLTLINTDAALADALTTAMFSMPKDTLKAFVQEHDLEVIAYQTNGEILNLTKEGTAKIEEPTKMSLETMLIIGAVSIILMAGVIFVTYYFKKKKKDIKRDE